MRTVTGKLLESVIDKALAPKNKKRIGKLAVRLIQVRTRLGFGVRSGEKVKLKPLADSTVKRRRKKALSGLTGPGTSNLTESGQMLEDITFTVKSDTVSIDFSTARSQKIAQYHHEGAGKLPKREFFDLTDKELKQLRVELQDIIDETIGQLN